MKNIFLSLFLLSNLGLRSQSSSYLIPVAAPSEITKNIMSWLYYENTYVIWSADYITFDTSFQKISKKNFLEQLMTGKYFPLRIKTLDSSLCYQLYKLDNSTEREIGTTIKLKAIQEIKYFEMEGTSLPKFDFIDLNGSHYNDSTTKGKILVLNCWFIHCKPCNDEIPILNQLVETYSENKNIIFIGLAFDPTDDLKKFLKKTRFEYSIIPDKENYLLNDLRISSFPTHLIINSQGKIIKVIAGKVNELIDVLDKVIK